MAGSNNFLIELFLFEFNHICFSGLLLYLVFRLDFGLLLRIIVNISSLTPTHPRYNYNNPYLNTKTSIKNKKVQNIYRQSNTILPLPLINKLTSNTTINKLTKYLIQLFLNFIIFYFAI